MDNGFQSKIDKLNIDNLKKEVSKDESNKKCSPSITFDGLSCIRLFVLIKLVEAYNKDVTKEDEIELSTSREILSSEKYKAYLIDELTKRVSKESNGKCTYQKCWSKQKFMNNLDEMTRKEFMKYTFKPDSPEGKFEWLSTLDIDNVMNQYQIEHRDFIFMGTVPMDFKVIGSEVGKMDYDELLKNKKTKIGIVFNLDNHNQGGSHWVSMFINLEKGQIYYFDSVGIKPEERVRNLMREVSNYLIKNKGFTKDTIDLNYNRIQHQSNNK
jgi:hypothetical protein